MEILSGCQVRLSWAQKFGPPIIGERDPFWKITPEIEAPRLRLV